MRTLWFRQEYVQPILTGSKTTTMRRPSTRLPKQGETIALSVGPRAAFATVQVLEVEELTLAEISDTGAQADGFKNAAACRTALRALYPEQTRFSVIRFKLTSEGAAKR